jgi:hypothetical protein
VILRHDIDMDLGVAVNMSSLKEDCGVHSTYFFMVRSPLIMFLVAVGRNK